VIALIGLNLTGAVATRSFRPIDPSSEGGGSDFGRGHSFFLSDGSIYVVRTDFSISASQRFMVRILYRRLPPTTPQIWAPVLASVAITILVITVLIGSPARRGQRPSSSRSQETSARQHPFRSMVRWMAIGCALIALMIAGAAYRPPPYPSDEEIRSKLIDLSDVTIDNEGDVYYVLANGFVQGPILRRHNSHGAMRGPVLRQDNSRGDIAKPDLYVPKNGTEKTSRLRVASGLADRGSLAKKREVISIPFLIRSEVDLRPIKTVVFKEDGSILGYDEFPSDPKSIPHGSIPPSRALWQRWFPVLFEWTPGPLPSQPFVIRDRVRSALEMRSPILASAAIAILTLVVLRRRARSQWIGSVSTATTSPCQSLP
jgi:hypothetical protein